MKRSILASLIILPLLFTTACSNVESTRNGQKAPSSAPASPEKTKATDDDNCTIKNDVAFGDHAVGYKKVTDDAGTYCSITVSPSMKDEYIQINDKEKVADSLREHFTQEDLDAVQEAALKFIVEQTIDSRILDTAPGKFNSWVQEEGFVSDEWEDAYIENYNEKKNPAGLLLIEIPSSPLIRDGQPRQSFVQITPETLAYGTTEGTDDKYIIAEFSFAVGYRATDETIISTIKKYKPEWSDDEIFEKYPELNDSDPNSFYQITANQTLTYLPEDGKVDKIFGSYMQYSAFGPNGESFYTN